MATDKADPKDMDMDAETLKRIQTSQSFVTVPPDVFEKLYLSPQNKVAGELRKTFANPTPVAVGGFLLALTPLSCALLGWRGAGLLGIADIGTYFFCGGMLLILGGAGEWFLGNNFPCTAFFTLGAFFLTYGSTLDPRYGAYAAYATDPSNPATGLQSTAFAASFAYFLLAMGILCFIFAIASIRTNVAFSVIFWLLVPAFGCLAGAFWQSANGQLGLALKLQHAGGGLAFAISLIGWYIFAALVLAGVDFPVALPLFDLSTRVPGASDLARRRKGGEAVPPV